MRLDMINSQAYRSLTATQQALLPLLQVHWKNYAPVSYGVRQASQKLKCSHKTAINAFKALQDRGFIICLNESLFNSRNGSKARDWRLTWMPYQFNFPSNQWEKWQDDSSIKPPLKKTSGAK